MDRRPSRPSRGDGTEVSYYFSREYPSADCPDCRTRRCTQRVEYAPEWGDNVRITHGAQQAMS